MTQKIKLTLACILLAFAGMSLGLQIGKDVWSPHVEQLRFADGLNVIVTHATTSCPTCLTMKRLTRETLDESFADAVAAGRIVFHEVNYEQPDAADFCRQFKVATAAVVLVYVRNGEIVGGTNLADEAWTLYADEPAFKQMLDERINAML